MAITLTVKQGSGWRKSSGFADKCDPYVKIEAEDGQSWQSKVVKNGGSDASWNETTTFTGQPMHFKLSVYDKDKLSKDDLLATGTLDLDPCAAWEGFVPLEGKKCKDACIYIMYLRD